MDVDTKSTLKVQDVYQKGVSWQCPWCQDTLCKGKNAICIIGSGLWLKKMLLDQILRAHEWSTFNETFDIKFEWEQSVKYTQFSISLDVMHYDNEFQYQIFNEQKKSWVYAFPITLNVMHNDNESQYEVFNG